MLCADSAPPSPLPLLLLPCCALRKVRMQDATGESCHPSGCKPRHRTCPITRCRTCAGAWRLAVTAFADAGFPCPQFKNPTDYFLGVASEPENIPELTDRQANRWNASVRRSFVGADEGMGAVTIVDGDASIRSAGKSLHSLHTYGAARVTKNDLEAAHHEANPPPPPPLSCMPACNVSTFMHVSRPLPLPPLLIRCIHWSTSFVCSAACEDRCARWLRGLVCLSLVLLSLARVAPRSCWWVIAGCGCPLWWPSGGERISVARRQERAHR